MRRDALVGLALAAIGAAFLALGNGALSPRGIAAACLVLIGTGLASWPRTWPRLAGAGAVVAALALAPAAASPLALLAGTLAILFALAVATLGIPEKAWLPIAVVVALGAAVVVAPALLAPRVVDATSPGFFLLAVGILGPPCAAIAIARRERRLEGSA